MDLKTRRQQDMNGHSMDSGTRVLVQGQQGEGGSTRTAGSRTAEKASSVALAPLVVDLVSPKLLTPTLGTPRAPPLALDPHSMERPFEIAPMDMDDPEYLKYLAQSHRVGVEWRRRCAWALWRQLVHNIQVFVFVFFNSGN